MNKGNNRLSIGVFVLFEITAIISLIDGIASHQRKTIWLSILAAACLILPFAIAKLAEKKKINLPHHFQLSAVLFIFLTQYLGEIKKFYTKYLWWDLFLHAVFGFYIAITALYMIKGIIRKEQDISDKRFAFFSSVFAFCFAVTLGTLWEIFEFLGDYLFKSNMVKGGIKDTASDLIVKSFAAFTASLISYFRRTK